MLIEDGKGTGIQARVDANNRLHTASRISSLQHSVSEQDQEAYQIIGTATAAAGTVVLLHITNNSTTRNMVFSYARLQNITLAGGTAIPNAANYFSIRLGRKYTSGGAAATAVNVYGGSSNEANITAYQTNPTLSGTALEIDRWYPTKDGDTEKYSKEGSIIIPAGQTIEIAYVGDHTSGTLYSRASFYMETPE